MIRKLLLVIILTFCATRMWGQTGDLSGTYYIGTRDYVSPIPNPNTNYYLCPTENWIYFDNDEQYGYVTSDNGRPFMTTYQCLNTTTHPTYDSDKAVWIVKYEITENGIDYYTIKHAIDNRYLTYNTNLKNIKNGNKNNRLRLHLETSESPSSDNNMLFSFKIPEGESYHVITPKPVSGYYLCLTEGNVDELQGSTTSPSGKKKEDGPHPYEKSIYGTLGIYTDIKDVSSPMYLEPVPVAPPSFTINTDGSVMLSATEGTTIYYTLDDSDPKSSETKKTGTTISASDIADATGDAIKAVAVDGSSVTSIVVNLPLKSYTYKIVNTSGNIAVAYTKKQAVGKPLRNGDADANSDGITDGFDDIPEDIRSSYIKDETIKFYSFDGDFSSSRLSSESPITKTPSAYNDIYVTYTTEKLGNNDKFLHLQGNRPFNIKVGDNYLYYYKHTVEDTEIEELGMDGVEKLTNKEYLWYILGNDPYDVQIQNAEKKQYLLTYTHDNTPAYSISSSASYILMSSLIDSADESTATINLKDASHHSFSITANTVIIPKNYILIDKANKSIQEGIPGEGTSELPSEWKSPLVSKYHYYTAATKSSDTYTVDPSSEIEKPSDASGTIYVTYDVTDKFDIEGKKTYMLKFLQGDEFYQEIGEDKVDKEKTKAFYPYNNGDFSLYVYGEKQWADQLAKSASTRSRWLWRIVSSSNGTPLTGNKIDPYHVIIQSEQDQKVKYKGVNKSGSTYFRTYKPEGYESVVTSVISKNPDYSVDEGDPLIGTSGIYAGVYKPDDLIQPTEYMILGTSMNSMKLRTVDEIDDARQYVTSFEQYWKNQPTANDMLVAGRESKVTAIEAYWQNATLTDAQRTILQNADDDIFKGAWHSYNAWAYAAPWNKRTDGTIDKKLEVKEHWFQTIDMGSGEFTAVETSLLPAVILLDQHGWEIMRLPINETAKLKSYDSPMVEKYHWYTTVDKVSGYHKYRVTGDAVYHTTSLGDVSTDEKSDFYVTYTVKSDYANMYTGAATKGATSASPVVLKQGDKYVALGSGNALAKAEKPESMENVPTEMRWYLKPNFDIDKEMGYKYDVKDGDSHIITEEETNAAYHDNDMSGFDPYNVQIQSVSNTDLYLTTSTSKPKLENGVWTGTATDVSLMTEKYFQLSAEGYDQTTLKITNATFMVVGDANGNMQLMPRFDNGKRVQLWSDPKLGEQANAYAGDYASARSLTFERAAHWVSSPSEMTDMGGYYILNEGFTCNSSIGTAAKPFTGIIDGKLNIINGQTAPLIDYADGATVRNVIMKNVAISTSGNAGAIANVVMGTSGDVASIYNCGILSGSVSGSDNVGGIVGLLGSTSDNKKCYARVINCYSYATVAGGNNVGGIVGYNTYKSKASDIRTMVMNCMFYGDITSGTNVSPVYGGEIIDNLNNQHDHIENYESGKSLQSVFYHKIIQRISVKYRIYRVKKRTYHTQKDHE